MIEIAVQRNSQSQSSGYRFYTHLQEILVSQYCCKSDFSRADTKVVLFNADCNAFELLRCRLSGATIVLRLDGLFFEEIGYGFIEAIKPSFIRPLLRFLYKTIGPSERLSTIANLVAYNWKLVAKVQLANSVIYQSNFSRENWECYFPKKRSFVVLNGTVPRYRLDRRRIQSLRKKLRFLLFFEPPTRPLKRFCQLLEFLKWKAENGEKFSVSIVGYRNDAYLEHIRALEGYGVTVDRYPPFSDIGEVRSAFIDSHIMLFASFRDWCPNSVIEALSFSLPVVFLDSGGVHEIVQDAGIAVEDPSECVKHFVSFRFSNNIPRFSFEKFECAIDQVLDDYRLYADRAYVACESRINITTSAEQYYRALQNVLNGSHDIVPE